MRTPAAMTLGLVLAPCGLLLALTSTLAPGWRLVKGFLDQPRDVALYQGLWDMCREQSGRERACGQQDALGYFQAGPVRAARGLMLASLAAAALGLLLAALGVRCWGDEPRFALAGAAGLALFAAGLLGLVPVSWYHHVLQDRAVLPAPASPVSLEASYSVVLGYLGSCLLLLGGLSLALSFAPGCRERCRRRRKASRAAAPRAPGISTVYADWPPPPPALAPAIKYYSGGQHRPRPAAAPGPAAAARQPRVGFPLPRPPPKTSYSNPVDVLDGEAGEAGAAGSQGGASSRSTRPCQSSLPCDSDL